MNPNVQAFSMLYSKNQSNMNVASYSQRQFIPPQNYGYGYNGYQPYCQGNPNITKPQPPPLPPAPPSSINIIAPSSNWNCEPCSKSFPSQTALDAHVKSHEKCNYDGCEYIGTKKTIIAHFNSTHGPYSGKGFENITVEGQVFRVLLGTDPDDVAQWRHDRRKHFPTVDTIKEKEEINKLIEASGGIISSPSSSSSQAYNNKQRKRPFNNDGEENTTNDGPPKKKDIHNKKPCHVYLKYGKCKFGNKCRYIHDLKSSTNDIHAVSTIAATTESVHIESSNIVNEPTSESNSSMMVVVPQNEGRIIAASSNMIDTDPVTCTTVSSSSSSSSLSTTTILSYENNCNSNNNSGNVNDIHMPMTSGIKIEEINQLQSHTQSQSTSNNHTNNKNRNKKQPVKDTDNNNNNNNSHNKIVDTYTSPPLLKKLLQSSIEEEENMILQCLHYIATTHMISSSSETI